MVTNKFIRQSEKMDLWPNFEISLQQILIQAIISNLFLKGLFFKYKKQFEKFEKYRIFKKSS